MDKHLEIQYVNRLGVYLSNFKQTKPRHWAFSHTCEKNEPGRKQKVRGSIYEIKDGEPFNVKCFHCGYSVKFTTLLKEISPSLYDEYRLHFYREPSLTKPEVAQKALEAVFKDRPEYFVDESLKGLIPVTSLSATNPVIRFLERRMIPKNKYNLLYVVKNFYEWASKFKEEFKNSKDDSPRLVLPYFDLHGRVLGFTARAFSPAIEPRYIHIRIDKDKDFVYGTERIDPSKTIFVTEGQIDSLFIDNCVAVGGAHYGTDFMKSIKTNCVIIPDNDWKRNPQVGKQLKKVIKEGYKICFMPDTVAGKDINDIHKAGMSLKEIREMILENTKSGLQAELEFATMRKY